MTSVKTGVCGPRSVFWKDGSLHLIDQRVLPSELTILECKTVQNVWESIRNMTVRGAPAIGAAGAFGIAIAARDAAAAADDRDAVLKAIADAKEHLDSARPTAVNLSWATARIVDIARAAAAARGDLSGAALARVILDEAEALADDDVAINRSIGQHGARLIPHGANLIHHCNTGALATVDYGTALGIIYECHAQGKGIHVWVDETRPRLQGARLTAWELMQAGVPMHLIADSAAGVLLRAGKVDAVVVGADRVAANGDVVNKIGTYKLAVCARENGVPVYAAVPTSTLDLTMPNGDAIPIEERSADEVTHVAGGGGVGVVAPEGVPVYNPAFDVTPAKYITGIVTEVGVCYPPFSVSLRDALSRAQAQSAAAWSERLERLKQ